MPRLGNPSVLTPSGVLGYCNDTTSLNATTTSDTAVDLDATNLAVTFTAPPSGVVKVTLSGYMFAGNSVHMWCLRAGSTTVTGSTTQVVNAQSDAQRRVAVLIIPGLTPGQTYTWKWAWYRQSGSSTMEFYVSSGGTMAVMVVEAVGGTIAATTDADVAPVAPNDQTGTTYTFALADKHRLVTAGHASASTYTIPLNATVPYPIGTTLQVYQAGAGQVTFAITATGTLRVPHGAKIAVRYGIATATKVGTDEWVVAGDVMT